MRSTRPRARRSHRRLAAAGLAAVAWSAAIAGCGGDSASTGDVASIARDGRSPRVPSTDSVRVLVELRRPPLGERVASSRLDGAGQRDYVSSLNGEVGALLGALRAKGVRLGGVVQYARVWHGFAATVPAGDVQKVQALGLRVEPVRRFYGALATGSRAPGYALAAARNRGDPAGKHPTAPAVALLDSGVNRGLPGLRGRVVPGPDLSGGGSGDRHGTAMASVLAAALPRSEQILSVRVAQRERDGAGRAPSESTTTDRLLAGLERAVDPNGDGDASDAVPVALVGVSSPYAGFDDAPEARAVRAAGGLGTLVVAPAGNEGRGAGAFGTVGSPAAAPQALAAGALERPGPAEPTVELGIVGSSGRAIAHGTVLGGRLHARRVDATTLSGPSQADPRGRAAAPGASPLEYLTVDARPKARRRLVVVPLGTRDGAGPAPIADRAAAAAAAGAAGLAVCQPDGGAPLAPVPAGVTPGMPVIGLTGADARRVLDLARSGGTVAFLSSPRPRHASGSPRVGRDSSRGPTYALAPKPDLVVPGTALVPAARDALAFVSGTSVAAARVAAAAVVLHRRRPALRPAQLAAALTTTARPLGAPGSDEGRRPDPASAAGAVTFPSPSSISFPPQPPKAAWTTRVDLQLANTGRAPAVLRLTPRIDPRVHVAVFPSRFLMAGRSTARVVVTASAGTGAPGFISGEIAVRGPGSRLAIPLAVPLQTPPRPVLGGPRLVRRGGQVIGVAFAAGSVRREHGAIAVEAIRALTLVLLDGRGRTVRELTPLGGAPDVLPGEYSYTLPSGTSRSLHGRGYRFRVSATGTAGGSATVESPAFDRP